MDMQAEQLATRAAAQCGGGPAPVRRRNAIRRTTSIDTYWPEGRDAPSHILARCRDIATDADSSLVLLSEDCFEARAQLSREIVAISSTTEPRLARFSGLRAGGTLRAALRACFVEPREQDSGLYLLLDDLAGATLVSSWGWFAWDGFSNSLAERINGTGFAGNGGDMRGVCIGFAAGSSAFDDNGFPRMNTHHSAPVPSLVNPDDPEGWHALPDIPGPSSRRARWIEVFEAEDTIAVETGFQDSALTASGQRQAIHEYRAEMSVDRETRRITRIEATPYVLPHRECPAAIGNIALLRGLAIAEIRERVPQVLAREAGCTHLNDVLRALVGVPSLAAHLPGLK